MDLDARLARAKDAIVTVDAGRGFLVTQAPWPPRVITAGHCLPHLPPAHPWSHTEERTYPNLLGPLGLPPTIAAECMFVDPIADLAVLECPDGQVLCDEAEAYEEFMEGRPALRIGTITELCTAWLLTLAGEWERCTMRPSMDGRSLTLIDATDGNVGG